TVTPLLAAPTLPLSSTARLRSVALPSPPGIQLKLQVAVPCATCHVAPLSTETSTLATTPPVSVAVPVIVTGLPLWTCALATGAVVEIFVPLIAQRAGRQRLHACGERGDARVLPDAQAGHRGGHGDRRRPRIDRPARAGQAILGPAAVGRRAEPRVAPRTGPNR